MTTRSPSVDELLEIVGHVYESVFEPGQMSEALAALNRCMDGFAAQTYTWHHASGAVLDSQTTEDLTPEANLEYVKWGAVDPRARKLMDLPGGSVVQCHKYFDEKFVARSSFYQDFFIPYGLRWAMGAKYDSPDGTSTVIAAVRSVDAPPFEDWTAQTLRSLMPHFQKASMLQKRWREQSAGAVDVGRLLDCLPMPGMLIDDRGRAVAWNVGAEQIWKDLSIRCIASFVRWPTNDLQLRWRIALSEATRGIASHAMSLNAGGVGVNVHFIPWRWMAPAADAFDLGLVFVCFERTGPAKHERIGHFAARHGLTSAESDVLQLIVEGRSVKEIATRRGASANTIRSQVAAVLRKTGMSSRNALIALLLAPEGRAVLPSA